MAKISIFLIIASSLAAIVMAAPSSSSPESIDCYIVYLKSKNAFTAEYDPVPSSSTLANCDKILKKHRERVNITYNNIFSRNENTANKSACIMENFNDSDAFDYILLNFVYEAARKNNQLDKKTFCKLSNETKQKTENDLRERVKKCNPNSQFDAIFTFLNECEDPMASATADINN